MWRHSYFERPCTFRVRNVRPDQEIAMDPWVRYRISQPIGADILNFSLACTSITEQSNCDTSCHQHKHGWNAFARSLAKKKSNDLSIDSTINDSSFNLSISLGFNVNKINIIKYRSQ